MPRQKPEKSIQCKHIELLKRERVNFGWLLHKLILSTFRWIRCSSFILIGDGRSASDFNCLSTNQLHRRIIIEWRMMNNDIPVVAKQRPVWLKRERAQSSYRSRPTINWNNNANKLVHRKQMYCRSTEPGLVTGGGDAS